jgi:ABC-type phosphonate transport system ATPase subunit
MNIKSFKTIALAAVTMAAMCAPVTANAQLGGLINKAKKKAKETVEQVVDKKKTDVQEKAKEEVKNAKNDAKMKALETQRPPLPWIMGLSKFSEDTIKAFARERLGKLPDDNVIALRDSLFARYKSNKLLMAAMKEAQIDDYRLNESLENEQQRFNDFYNQLEWSIVPSLLLGVKGEKLDGESATMKYERPRYHVVAGISTYSAFKTVKGDVYFMSVLGGTRVFLKANEAAEVKAEIDRVRKIILLSQGIGTFAKEVGDKPEAHGFLPFLANDWVTRVDAALANNKPENIEYRPMPKAGTMHAKFKAEALAIAKADDPKVIDVVITSNDWDVVMKGLVPERRNIYGYYITQDELGKICTERVWTQKYQGDGKYGKLRAGGVGVSTDFYVK